MRTHKQEEVDSKNDETNESILHIGKEELAEELFLHIDNHGEPVEDTEEEADENSDE